MSWSWSRSCSLLPCSEESISFWAFLWVWILSIHWVNWASLWCQNGSKSFRMHQGTYDFLFRFLLGLSKENFHFSFCLSLSLSFLTFSFSVFILFAFLFLRILLRYSLAQRFFPQLGPVYQQAHQWHSSFLVTVFLILIISFWFFFRTS